MRLVLIGDGESPHLLKWARALVDQVELWAASTRGFAPEFSFLIPEDRRLALDTRPDHGGGNLAVIKQLPRLGQWLAKVDADWLHPHYLTSHGTLAWAARKGWRLRARIVGSAWGSDILVTPNQGWGYRWLTRQVLQACTLTTSDSEHMAQRMRELGAGEVMTFPFGLEALPKQNVRKQPWLFYANRGLEPIYRPHRVIEAFAVVAAQQPAARLLVANDGSLRAALEDQVRSLGLADRVEFLGRLDAVAQGRHYAHARWFLSLPESDSVSVSVIEAMAHECLPVLSDLPANHELLGEGRHGLILSDQDALTGLPARLDALVNDAHIDAMGAANRAWVAHNALFGPAVKRFVARLNAL
ncbi:glycosyltransferase [Roseateles depolymerans]|uniref:Group 1 glycosyl transferase n=1 Tax=Roseateles depolymerans TaxID=76731 RepID=A0A0U3MIK1_9BURK|nr:glycosyltransferase [Roseateles depolymerans]ALV08509.1 Group 1 glycosyl transferase [Roseateles depolymerans]REG21265.1 glycosyltransferase involved in cell wall biosynthesis [Roseateles depolymerans]